MDQQDLARLNTIINKLQLSDSLDSSLTREDVQLMFDVLSSARNIQENMMDYKILFGTVNIPELVVEYLLDIPVIQWLQKSLKNEWYLISFSYYEYTTEDVTKAFEKVFKDSHLSISVVMGISFEQTQNALKNYER